MSDALIYQASLHKELLTYPSLWSNWLWVDFDYIFGLSALQSTEKSIALKRSGVSPRNVSPISWSEASATPVGIGPRWWQLGSRSQQTARRPTSHFHGWSSSSMPFTHSQELSDSYTHLLVTSVRAWSCPASAPLHLMMLDASLTKGWERPSMGVSRQSGILLDRQARNIPTPRGSRPTGSSNDSSLKPDTIKSRRRYPSSFQYFPRVCSSYSLWAYRSYWQQYEERDMWFQEHLK